MPIPQALHRLSTKVRKFVKNGHYRLRAGSQNPCLPCVEKNFEKPASIGKSTEKEKEIKHHFNLWDPLKQKTKSVSGMVSKKVVVLLMALLGMVYQATQLPPTLGTGSSEDSPSSSDSPSSLDSPSSSDSPSLEDSSPSSTRIKLKDGRYLAYRERGVPKEKAKYKIVVVHGLGSSKEMNFLAPQELIDELGIYFLLYDRAGYGESDPDRKRTVKREAFDIQELADQLELGPKFYVVGVSMGSYTTWSCLKYIPERLAGVAFVVPVVNYWWPSLPHSLIREDYRRKLVRWSIWFAKYAPGLLYWWVTQKWLPSNSVLERNPIFFNDRDIDTLKTISGFPMLTQDKIRERSVFDTLRHDFMLAFGKWGFDPMDISNPYPKNESSVHIWQGYEDKVVPVQLQRFVSGKLPWIRYHEVPDGGHLIVYYNGVCEAILRALLLGEEAILYRPRKTKVLPSMKLS